MSKLNLKDQQEDSRGAEPSDIYVLVWRAGNGGATSAISVGGANLPILTSDV